MSDVSGHVVPIQVPVLLAKIHRATVTDADLHYEGSITIDRTLMDLAGIVAFQQVQIYNVTNGARFETYVIEGAGRQRLHLHQWRRGASGRHRRHRHHRRLRLRSGGSGALLAAAHGVCRRRATGPSRPAAPPRNSRRHARLRPRN